MRTAGAIALSLAVVLAGCGAVDVGALLSGRETVTAPCDEDVSSAGGERLADPKDDVLGWEDGVWYNESIGVTQADGLTCGELELVLARAMARVEEIRRLEFESTPTLTVADTGAFRDRVTGGDSSVPEDRRAFANVKFEALLLVNESADAVAVQRRNRGASVGGFYAPGEDTIYLPTEDVSEVRIDGGVLAHELVHALQDQHFAEVEFPEIEDTSAAYRGVTEGDANYVEYRYERRCEGPWMGTCPRPVRRDELSDPGPTLANLGLYVISYQPYSDGPSFVKRIRERGGWEAVDGLYRDLPESTEQTIHPRLYPDEEPRRVEVRDRSDDRWNRVAPEGQPDYETWGERGLFAMFLYPAFESGGETTFVRPESFRTPNGSSLDPYNYSYGASAGWAGDRLLAYRDDDGDLAYTWKIAFDTRRDAREFSDAYEDVLQYRGAHRVDGRPNVWRVPEGEPFADAFYVERSGDTVLIVNAPTVDGLADVDGDVDAGG